MSGFTTPSFQLGLPDIGLITMKEMVENAKNICEAVNISVIAKEVIYTLKLVLV